MHADESMQYDYGFRRGCRSSGTLSCTLSCTLCTLQRLPGPCIHLFPTGPVCHCRMTGYSERRSIRRWQKKTPPVLNISSMSNIVQGNQNHLDFALWANRRRNCNCRYGVRFNTRVWKGSTTICREALWSVWALELWSSRANEAENKSTQQSWPTFVLECFQRQQSLFSYAINCLNRLPVEFLMCYKFRVCFSPVDSTLAYCVGPVISAGLGRTSSKEKKRKKKPLLKFTFSLAIVCRSEFLFTIESVLYICIVHQWPCAM